MKFVPEGISLQYLPPLNRSPCGVLVSFGLLSHRSLLNRDDEPKILSYDKTSKCSTSADVGPMTLKTLHWLNVIPPFKYNPFLWADREFLKSGTNELYQCLRHVNHLVITLMYARIIALASTNRSSWGAFSVLASVTITTVGIFAFGQSYTRYLAESTDCVRTSIRRTQALRAEA